MAVFELDSHSRSLVMQDIDFQLINWFSADEDLHSWNILHYWTSVNYYIKWTPVKSCRWSGTWDMFASACGALWHASRLIMQFNHGHISSFSSWSLPGSNSNVVEDKNYQDAVLSVLCTETNCKFKNSTSDLCTTNNRCLYCALLQLAVFGCYKLNSPLYTTFYNLYMCTYVFFKQHAQIGIHCSKHCVVCDGIT